jgi:hypothetical protein
MIGPLPAVPDNFDARCPDYGSRGITQYEAKHPNSLLHQDKELTLSEHVIVSVEYLRCVRYICLIDGGG